MIALLFAVQFIAAEITYYQNSGVCRYLASAKYDKRDYYECGRTKASAIEALQKAIAERRYYQLPQDRPTEKIHIPINK